MLNATTMEEEKPLTGVLPKTFSSVLEVNIKATPGSVKENIEYGACYHKGDINFGNVQLSDRLSFAIFNQAGVQIPVIFITVHDHYTMITFEKKGIDCLMKSVIKPASAKLPKYNKLQTQFPDTIANTPPANQQRFSSGRIKTRLLVKKGLENIVVRLEDIVLIYTQNKLVYVVDRLSKKYISDKNLSELEDELDNIIFFRANRQYIVNINYIKSFKTHEKVKLLIGITIPEINHSIVVSQETSPAFRKWMLDA